MHSFQKCVSSRDHHHRRQQHPRILHRADQRAWRKEGKRKKYPTRQLETASLLQKPPRMKRIRLGSFAIQRGHPKTDHPDLIVSLQTGVEIYDSRLTYFIPVLLRIADSWCHEYMVPQRVRRGRPQVCLSPNTAAELTLLVNLISPLRWLFPCVTSSSTQRTKRCYSNHRTARKTVPYPCLLKVIVVNIVRRLCKIRANSSSP